MPTSDRYIHITFSEGTSGTNRVQAASNTASPCGIYATTLISGDNTIIQPSNTITAVTIVPPDTNTTVDLILKGNASDVGIPLHKTDPTSIALGTSPTIIIHASDTIVMKFIWT